jgi:hypothetical protein
MELAAGQQADEVDPHVRDVADEQAVSMVAALPCRRSSAEPVVWVRLLRKTQLRKSTDSCDCPRCSTETPPPQGLV